MVALHERDGAEGAALVAAVRDLHVRARPGWPCAPGSPGRARPAAPARPAAASRRARAALPAARQPTAGPTSCARRQSASTAGSSCDQLIRVALDQAARGDELLAGALGVAQLEQGIDRLLLGRLDEAARVDDQQVGRRRDRRPAGGRRPAAAAPWLRSRPCSWRSRARQCGTLRGRARVTPRAPGRCCGSWRVPLTVMSTAEPILTRMMTDSLSQRQLALGARWQRLGQHLLAVHRRLDIHAGVRLGTLPIFRRRPGSA